MNAHDFGIDDGEMDVDVKGFFEESEDDSDGDEPFEIGKSGSSKKRKRNYKKRSNDDGKIKNQNVKRKKK
jgi:hypothetical protein